MGHGLPDVYSVLEVQKLSKNPRATSNIWHHKGDTAQKRTNFRSYDSQLGDLMPGLSAPLQ
jgi:hypothetical protein